MYGEQQDFETDGYSVRNGDSKVWLVVLFALGFIAGIVGLGVFYKYNNPYDVSKKFLFGTVADLDQLASLQEGTITTINTGTVEGEVKVFTENQIGVAQLDLSSIKPNTAIEIIYDETKLSLIGVKKVSQDGNTLTQIASSMVVVTMKSPAHYKMLLMFRNNTEQPQNITVKAFDNGIDSYNTTVTFN
mgnify:CR=1 FL=1